MPLAYRNRNQTVSGTQLDVMCGSLNLCYLRKAMQSIDARGESWEWSWHLQVAPPGFDIHGRAKSKPEAQAEIERQWRLWLDAAGLDERQ